jgi:hypothetical protein
MNIKETLRRWCHEGMYLPFVHDPVNGTPSVTLMFFYASFVMAVTAVSVSSTMLLLKGEYLQATAMPTFLCAMGFVFYRLRQLDKVKIDFNDQEIELSSSSEEEKDNQSE